MQVEAQEDARDDRRLGEEREDLHLSAATGTEKRKHAINASEEHGPADAGEPLQQLERREPELGAAVGRGSGKPIDEAAVVRGQLSNTSGSIEPFGREGWTRAVPEQPLDACPVVSLDTHGGVDTEPSRAPPSEHAVGVGLVE